VAQRVFAKEERERAVQRVADGERPTAVARDVGCHVTTLRGWTSASGHAEPSHGREPDGRFKKGYTPNPGGSTTHIERAQRMIEEAAPEVVAKLLRFAEDLEREDDPDAVEVKASKGHVLNKIWAQILDRGLGKATQRVKQEVEDVAIIVDIGGE
jgi:transposase-like protein